MAIKSKCHMPQIQKEVTSKISLDCNSVHCSVTYISQQMINCCDVYVSVGRYSYIE